jgi:hypothetical protein
MLKLTSSNIRRDFLSYRLLQLHRQFFNGFVSIKLMNTAFQCRFNNGEGVFDWIVIRRIGWKEFEFTSALFDECPCFLQLD